MAPSSQTPEHTPMPPERFARNTAVVYDCAVQQWRVARSDGSEDQ